MAASPSGSASDHVRYVGIDEAGYGPNLGPLAMVAVILDGPRVPRFDLWNDVLSGADRAGGEPRSLWIDDSKRVTQDEQGLARLLAAILFALRASSGEEVSSFGRLCERLGAGSLEQVELTALLSGDHDPVFPPREHAEPARQWSLAAELIAPEWTLRSPRARLVGPRQFNAGLDRLGSKAAVHFQAFAELLTHVWELADDGAATFVQSDKHGGRHYYLESLHEALPGVWIDRLEERAELSRYVLRGGGRQVELRFSPRADSENGLVAWASMIAKGLREAWMTEFNRAWGRRIPGLKPTAGYPVDARRFRGAIESWCQREGLHPDEWWRRK